MKNVQKAIMAFLVASCLTIYSCKPNDSKGAEDQENSQGEGAVDSSRLTHIDSSSATTPAIDSTKK